MSHRIEYRDTITEVSNSDAKSIIDEAVNWADADTDRYLLRVHWDRENDTLALSVRVTNVSNLDTALSDFDSQVSSLNSTLGVSFAMPSEKANIQPM